MGRIQAHRRRRRSEAGCGTQRRGDAEVFQGRARDGWRTRRICLCASAPLRLDCRHARQDRHRSFPALPRSMQFGWTADEAASFAVMDAFADAGGNFIDTADIYSSWVPGNKGGDAEEIIGRWMKRAATGVAWSSRRSCAGGCGTGRTATASAARMSSGPAKTLSSGSALETIDLYQATGSTRTRRSTRRCARSRS